MSRKIWLKGTALYFFGLLGLLLFPVCSSQRTDEARPVNEKFELIEQISGNPDSSFFIDFARYPKLKDRSELPIGIFDSGTGGLTVLDAILAMDAYHNRTHEPGPDGVPDFAAESFIYLGDSANMPYGRYESEGKADFLKELILKDVQFLLGNKYYAHPKDDSPQTDKPQVKAIVIACNTATAFGLELVLEAFERWGLDVRVIGIIDAGAHAVVSEIPADRSPGVIAVFATEGACASGGYPRALNAAFSARLGIKPAVVQQPGFGLAGAIDGDRSYIDPDAIEVRKEDLYQGPSLNHPRYPIHPELWEEYHFEAGGALLVEKDEAGALQTVQLNSVVNYIRYYVTELVMRIKDEYPGHSLDTVILGCTHYPYFAREIRTQFDYLRGLSPTLGQLISPDIRLIDPALSEAHELYQYLSEKNLFSAGEKANNRFFISVPNPGLTANRIDSQGNFPLDYKYGRFPNRSLMYVKRVPLSPEWVVPEVWNMIKIKMPRIYRLLEFGVIEK